jgi:hypothetical protein
MGIPGDLLIKPWYPIWYQRLVIKLFVKILIGPYSRYGLQEPDHKLFEHHPTVNSDLLHYLQLGKIKPHPGTNITLNFLISADIKRYDGNTIEFVDGSKQDFDVIIFCTGYHTSLPMFSKDFIEFKDGVPQLVNSFLHPTYKHLYVFGVGQARYGAGSLISTAANLGLVTLIKTQDMLKHPISQILLKIKVGSFPAKVTKLSSQLTYDFRAINLLISF